MATLSDRHFSQVLREIELHWELVEEALPLGEGLRLLGTVSRAQFGELVARWEALRDEITALEVDERLVIEELRLLRREGVWRMRMFNLRVRADWMNTYRERVLGRVPGPRASVAEQEGALRETEITWELLEESLPEESGGEIRLFDGFGLAQFRALLETMEQGREKEAEVWVALRLARGQRELDRERLVPLVVAYRALVPAVLRAGHPLVRALPLYAPPRKKSRVLKELSGVVAPEGGVEKPVGA